MDLRDDEIAPTGLQELLGSGEEVRIVDVRSPAQFERGAIPESENVPFGELPGRIEAFADADRVVTVCPHGKASLRAMRLIESHEAIEETEVRSLAGGLDAWSQDYALESEESGRDGKRDACGGGSSPAAPF